MAKHPVRRVTNPLVDTIKFLVQLLTVRMKLAHYGFLVSLFVAYWAIHVEMQSNLKKANDNHIETKAIVSTVSDKSDKHVSKIDTVIMYEKQILQLLNK